jgi:hypothetical protein
VTPLVPLRAEFERKSADFRETEPRIQRGSLQKPLIIKLNGNQPFVKELTPN